jgi:hypothetical protein
VIGICQAASGNPGAQAAGPAAFPPWKEVIASLIHPVRRRPSMLTKKLFAVTALAVLGLLAVPWGSADAGIVVGIGRPYYRPHHYRPYYRPVVVVTPRPVVVAPAPVYVVPPPPRVVVIPAPVAVVPAPTYVQPVPVQPAPPPPSAYPPAPY